MQKVFPVLLSVFFLLSCSDDKDDPQPSGECKTVKVVVTRTSSNYTLFFLNTTLTIDNNKENYQISKSDFDMVLEDETNLLLIKQQKPITAKYEVEVKLRDVKIQVLENPILDSENEDIDWDTIEADLTTKVEIFVDGELKRTQNFVFDKESANLNIVQYSEK